MSGIGRSTSQMYIMNPVAHFGFGRCLQRKLEKPHVILFKNGMLFTVSEC